MIKIIDEDKDYTNKERFILYPEGSFAKAYDKKLKCFILSKKEFDEWEWD